MNNTIYIGIKGHVVAVDRTTGSELWRTHLAGSTYVTVYTDGGLFAGTRGRLYHLDPTTGSILWTNELPGLGYNMITFSGSTIAAAAAERNERRETAAAVGVAASS